MNRPYSGYGKQPTHAPGQHSLRVETIKVDQPVSIIVDHREPKVIVDHLRRCEKAQVTVDQLELGPTGKVDRRATAARCTDALRPA